MSDMSDPSTSTLLDPGLYVVGTPIGNLGDVTLRVLETLRAADIVFAEDTRISRRLLTRFDIKAPVWSCHRFNERARRDEVVGRIRAGQRVALMTDSGMPGVSDPGARMVAACREEGLSVTVLPGPSAVTAAIALCGFESRGFYFSGFLPPKSGARKKRLEHLLQHPDPVVLFESPFRFLKFLDALEECAPGRRVFVGREITKRFEETRVGTPSELKALFADRTPRGEFVIVIEPDSVSPFTSPAPGGTVGRMGGF